ncbi:acetyltransferase [Mucilaginibacter conchicola]|uniref:Acetyltransferase n=1 Tax=Mucilaginibacter conchicola TaxID=2303333 RepID=A0A372NU01_9SPHI|nr:acetyltransferase [Mucilaginibacter conchicola]RFZ92077.1 acetyltransferase [Mucilaginibacter conchicola]
MQNNIRQPQLAEYPVLLELWEASVRATHHFLSEKDIEFYRPLVATFLPMLDVYCVANDGHINGFIAIGEEMVQALFIHPDTRGQGIGKKLMDHAVKNLNITKVDVNEQNQQALGFYECLGFKVTGRSELDGAGKPYPILNMELEHSLSPA